MKLQHQHNNDSKKQKNKGIHTESRGKWVAGKLKG